ncbi:hypothetical protein AVEN_51252-1, partial [Araneus ventricosus]
SVPGPDAEPFQSAREHRRQSLQRDVRHVGRPALHHPGEPGPPAEQQHALGGARYFSWATGSQIPSYGSDEMPNSSSPWRSSVLRRPAGPETIGCLNSIKYLIVQSNRTLALKKYIVISASFNVWKHFKRPVATEVDSKGTVTLRIIMPSTAYDPYAFESN